MKITREEILAYHLGGKVGLALPRSLRQLRDLCMAYTPGVALPVREIAGDPGLAFDYTARGNLVAVVSDGTAILGLGDLGATASIPVMEGKAALFKSFADVNAWPVPLGRCRKGGLDTGPSDPERIIETVAALSPMYGGINLEDIAAPSCFEIEDRLDALLDIPVFHDDQWGTAVITLAGVINYALLRNRDISSLRAVINGAGAAGIRIADMLKAAGMSDVILCDSRGIVHAGRTDLNPQKRLHAVASRRPGGLAEALPGADVFIGVSVADCLAGDDLRKMADYPAIFAMANPDPEIRPEEAAAVMDGKPHVMATGRSDYPNQVNNVLGFPFLFRGALDVRAHTINMEMKVAAARALAELARLPVSPEVQALYPDEELSFGDGYVIPKPFDRRLLVEVSLAVSLAAVGSGVAGLAAGPQDLRRRLQERDRERSGQ